MRSHNLKLKVFGFFVGVIIQIQWSEAISDGCLQCICGVESNGRQPGCRALTGGTGGCPAGCNMDVGSCSCGSYQIKQAYFTDCSYRNNLPIRDWVGCATNEACATQCVLNYMQRYGAYCTNTDYDSITCAQFGGIHNGGPRGCNRGNTATYRNHVTQCCANGNVNCGNTDTGSSTECNGVTIVSRDAWDARAATGTTALRTPVGAVFIHHTDGDTCTSQNACERRVRQIQNGHMNGNGWSDIGYSFLVGEDGRVYEGRGWDNMGAHAPGNNAWSYGISIIGNYVRRVPNQAALTAVRNLIACGVQQGHIIQNYGLFGHRDGKCTACPGDALYNEIVTWDRHGENCNNLVFSCGNSNVEPTFTCTPSANEIITPTPTTTSSASASCTRYGDMMLLRPTGASERTARSDRLSVTGVAASNAMVTTDRQRLDRLKYCFDAVGLELGVYPALIAAIVSRESRGGSALDSRGYGDNGNGYGLMQCDINTSGLDDCTSHPYNSCEHIRYVATSLLIRFIEAVGRAHPSWRAEQQLQGGVAAYNFGVRNVQSWARLDIGTTNNDYSNDVIARAQYLVNEFGWTCPTTTGSTGALNIEQVSRDHAESYLARFGYMDNTNYRNGLRAFQRWFNLEETGNIDEQTSYIMTQPRCQNRDVHDDDDARRRKKRYAVLGTTWSRNELTYFVRSYPPATEMSRANVDSEIARAFQLWASVTSLEFTRQTTQTNADIIILFAERRHGDNSPFDGQGNTLAHAFQPNPGLGGDAHFDDAEVWTLNTNTGTNLYYVAVHEFGHSLGLDHSNEPQAVMYPTYRGYVQNLRLHSDDIRGIQSLYGPPAEADVGCKALADAGDCEFYRNCVQQKVRSCNVEEDYPMAYGYKYCTKFGELYNQFTTQGQRWVDEVRKCLMHALLGYIHRPGITCRTIAEIAFDSHVKCYLNSGPGFCNIIIDNMDALCNVYETGDFFGKFWKEAWKQVGNTLQRCYSKWWDDQTLIELLGTDWRLGREIESCAVSKFGNYLGDAWERTRSWFSDTWSDLFEDDSEELDCRFWEMFEYKFSCYQNHAWSFGYSFLLPLCTKFKRFTSLGPSATVGRWMERTQQCLINEVLSAYRGNSVDCMSVDTTLLFNIRTCMVESGLCSFDREEEFFLDRAIDTKGFPAQFPDQYTSYPLSGKSERLGTEYFLKLKWFKSMIGDANIMCYQRGLRSTPALYGHVENREYGIQLRRRTEL